MNTHAINTPGHASRRLNEEFAGRNPLDLIDLADITRTTIRLVAAAAVAGAFFVIASWMALTPSFAQFLLAGLWAVGFVFLALAIEPGLKRSWPLALTGLALPALAVLGSRASEGFTLMALIIVSAWIAKIVVVGMARDR